MASRRCSASCGKAGIDTGGATLIDSSGLSVDDRLTAETLDEVVNAAAGDATLSHELRPLVDLLPIAGGSGTLSNRFLDTDAGRDAAGYLRAKTGSLTGTNALAGFVTDDSGRVLTFSLISNNAGPTGRTAIDALAAALRSCGCGSMSAASAGDRRQHRRLGVRRHRRRQAGQAGTAGHRVHPQPGHRRSSRTSARKAGTARCAT